MELEWKFFIITCFITMIVLAFILARFIERLEKRVEQLEKQENIKTRIISKETEDKLLSTSESLTMNLRSCKDRSVLLSEMKEAEQLFSDAIKELEA